MKIKASSRASRIMVGVLTVSMVCGGSALVAVPAGADEVPESHIGLAETVSAIEDITGTDSLIQVAPGEIHDGITVPEEATDQAVIDSGGHEFAFTQPPGNSSDVYVSPEGTVTYAYEDEAFNVHLQVLESPDPELLSDGIRSLIEIQDATAATEYVFETQVPDGTQLEVAADGSVLGTDPDENIVLIVPAPWAVDAEGEAVPTRYRVEGTDLIQEVDFTATDAFPVIADPVWFIPLVVAGGRIIGQVAVNAATRAAAARAAATAAARTIVKKVTGKITGAAAKRCYKGAAVSGIAAAVPAHLQQTGDGKWKVKFGANGALVTVSSAVAGCLSTNIR